MAYQLLAKDRVADVDGCGLRGSGLMTPVTDADTSDLLVLSLAKSRQLAFRGLEGNAVGPFCPLRCLVGVLGADSGRPDVRPSLRWRGTAVGRE